MDVEELAALHDDAADRAAEAAALIVDPVHHHLGDGELAGAGLVASLMDDDLGEAGQLGIHRLRLRIDRHRRFGRGDEIAEATVADSCASPGAAGCSDGERLGRRGAVGRRRGRDLRRAAGS